MSEGPSDPDRRWQRDLQRGVRNAAELAKFEERAGELEGDGAGAVGDRFKVRIPASYLAHIDWSDPDDPIRKQAIPDPRELVFLPGELLDPIGDEAHSPVPHLTHRYPTRALLVPTYICSMYCRHCFRKEAINDEGTGFSMAALEPALAYIEAHTELRELILTGGDPLTLSDLQYAALRERLEAIPHLRMIRVHTRVPVSLPTRVTPELITAMGSSLMTCVVTHFNHPREISEEAIVACRRLREAGFMLLNQSVLLAGVNDRLEVMAELLEGLVYKLGAKPYYLHHCDLTRGVSHFRTSIEQGRALLRGLRGRISGLCMPEYVLDLPGGDGKVPIGPSYEQAHDGRRWCFHTWAGGLHHYREVLPSAGLGTLDPDGSR